MRPPASDLPLVMTGVGVERRGVRILDGIDLALAPGAPSCLVGPNGAGKTTLIRIAMGLDRPTAGQVTWGGNAYTDGRRQALVSQRPVMLRRSAAANVAYALAASGVARALRARRTCEMLARVGLSDLARRPARRLSGGEQQRLALARALAREPDILFLDEPTANLDPAATKAVEEIIRMAARSGVKIVLATHDLGQARRLAQEIVFLVRGRVAEHTSSEIFFTAPKSAEAAAFVRGDLVI
ncbi:MAG: ATP-binding cassette domain-containing protein [Proteobacteria bacterium]|nr:ATP-binding cassette domain-containing protein [Pseudomonadota bacterium]